MQKRMRIFIIGILTALVVSACDSTPPTATPVPPTPTVAASTTPADSVSMQDVMAVAGVRAHLLAADGLVRAGQEAAATQHVQIIQGELIPALMTSASTKPVAAGLSEAVGAYGGFLAINMQPDAAALQSAYKAALAAADSGIVTLGGPALDTAAGRTALVRDLLEMTEEEYTEALAGGSQIDREPYETAFGYFQVASEQYRNLQGILKATQPTSQPNLDEPFEQLARAFPGITGPATPPVVPADVEKYVDTINETLATLSGTGTAPVNYASVIADTRNEVLKAITQYTAGQSDAAYETAAGAYLNRFEGLEGPLGKKDATLVGELEGHFKDLRDGIKAGKPAADLQTIVDKINAGLDKAQQLLNTND